MFSQTRFQKESSTLKQSGLMSSSRRLLSSTNVILRPYKILLGAILSAAALAGCGGGSVESGKVLNALTCSGSDVPNSTNTACVAPPPPVCVLPQVLDTQTNSCGLPPDPNAPAPSVNARVDEAILFYNRPQDADNSPNDPVYEGWKLHTWSDERCDAYADGDTDWAAGRVHDGVDPNYGAYWVLPLKPGYAGTDGACANFIIHKGTDGAAGTDDGKEMQGGDFMMPLSQPGDFARMNWTFSGVAVVFENPLASLGVSIGDASAHWIDAQTFVWGFDQNLIDVAEARLYHSATADLAIEDGQIVNGQEIALTATTLSDEQRAAFPELADFPAFSGTWSNEDAKSVIKNQLVVAGFDSAGELSTANKVQIAKALDGLYTRGDNDANEQTLGVVFDGANITANVWAPTAQNMTLKVFDPSKVEIASHPMVLDEQTGIWQYTGSSELNRMFYRFEITVYHPVSGQIETLEVTDPYSVSLSTNGEYSQFVNLDDDDLKPQGWDSHTIPTLTQFEDAVIYEGHIRDFSIFDTSTSEENRGKYMAFTEQGTLATEHLTRLAEKGVTHFHMLPANDFATVNEDESQSLDLSSTVAQLCALNSNAMVCSEQDPNATLLSVFSGYDSASEPQKAQQLTNDMRGYDRFNWGYDPQHFTAPEGSFSSDPDGVARILEMRAMNQALHEMGLRVALDVVYNHTNASGLNDKSVLDKVVPGYYHRYDINSGAIIRETCCDDTEPRHVMMEKLMHDSLLVWTNAYKFDSFRFDIMSHASKDTMQRLEAAVQQVDPDNYFYGEGWTRTDRQFEQANQPNMAGTEIGTFNDRIREAVRQGRIFDKEANDGALTDQDRVKMSLAGTLTNYVLEDFNGVASTTSSIGGYATDPADIVNYVSKHDNETLWDQLNYSLPNDLSLSERVRAHNVSAAIPLMAQGIPFLQLGGDMLRSKSMDRNTFDSGDWFNIVDYSQQTNGWNRGLPLAQDNQNRWADMASFIYSPERAVSMAEIDFAKSVFDELLEIRTSSPLFRLTTGDEIIDRVGFHNIGSRQTQGLIVMSIDDGVATGEARRNDLDPMHDALVVVINTSDQTLSHSVATASGFELHPIQANSVDAVVRTASFSADDSQGTFSVPAYTIAVFVKPQGGAQGTGLSALATAGAPDVVPYGSTPVFLRGSMTDWGIGTAFNYQGNGVYQVTFALSANTEYQFKFASEDWSTVNFGGVTADLADVTVVEGQSLSLGVADNNNLLFTPSVDASYVFSVDATEPSAPVLTIVNEEPFVGTPIFLRGSMNGWTIDDELSYLGGRMYSISVELAPGDYQFKVASEDWATVNFGGVSGAPADREVNIGGETLLGQADDNNLQISITEQGQYDFILDVSNLSEPLLRVVGERFFASTPVYLRGSLNGWGIDDELTYQGAGVYSIEVTLDAGSVEFKVASEDWATVNLGGTGTEPEDRTMALDVGRVLGQANDNNLLLQVDTAGRYEFRIVGPDANAPTLTISPR